MIARWPNEVANSATVRVGECPICRFRELHSFMGIPRVPVTCTSIFDSQIAARNVPAGEIDLCACKRCGFVFNRSFDPRLGELGAQYESSQAASAHFSAFSTGLARDWVLRHRLQGKTILEVGSGGGDFMRHLLAAGAGRVVGIDPLAASSADPQVSVVTANFDPRQHDFDAHALVCRHTLEHVQDVSGFLQGVYRWAAADSDRVVLFELPDAERIFSQRAFWDVYYEHCNYFTAESVRVAFESAGFSVLRIDRVYDDQYLLVEAIAGDNGYRFDETASTAIASCDRFASDVRASVDRCKRSLASLSSAEKGVVLWQGAAKTVGLLTFLGDTTSIEFAVDLNPQRHNRFLPGTGLAVFAPEHLRHFKPAHIVLLNPAYLNEVRVAVRDLGSSAPVHSINDLLNSQDFVARP